MDPYSPYSTPPGGQAGWSGYGYPPAPPQWPPPFTWEPTPPPPRGRSVVALLLLAVLMAAVGAGIAVAVNNLVQHGAGSLASAVNGSVVDVDSDLGDGETAAGTGMVLNSSGEVLTNNHVIDGALHITVQIAGGTQTWPANVVGYDPADDIAVLQLSGASGMTVTKFGDSSRVNVGDSVTVVGNALGRGGPPSTANGTVVALDQTITATDEDGSNPETLNGMIEFNAGIQPGDSGGPLVGSGGTVVGMDTAGSSTGRRVTAGDVGYAIPIDSALSIAHQIMSGATAPNIQRGARALLGVGVVDSTTPPGALVNNVVPGDPADSVGIGGGDVITAVGSTPVTSAATLKTALAPYKPGDTVTVTWVDQSGQQHSAPVTLASAPPS